MPATVEERGATASICVACRFGRGDDRVCVLLHEQATDRLLGEGPCRLSEWIRKETLALLHRRYPFAASVAEDIASEVLLGVIDHRERMLPEGIHYLSLLRRRLKEMIRSRTIDSLRHHRLVARLRCGVCVHFETDERERGCQLRMKPRSETGPAPNPWFRKAKNADQDPRGLEPPCEAFEWRKPQTHDLFEEQVGGDDGGGSHREQAVKLLVEAIDRVSRQGEDGLRVAGVLFWHYLRGKDVKELAKEAKVSDKTIKRQLAEGRRRLLQVLTDEMGIEDPEELA